MSQKRKMQRAARREREEKQAKNVVKWICGVFVLVAVAALIYVALM